jgi:hypothetical protein
MIPPYLEEALSRALKDAYLRGIEEGISREQKKCKDRIKSLIQEEDEGTAALGVHAFHTHP